MAAGEALRSLRHSRSHALLIEGTERHGGQRMTVFYVGSGDNVDSLADLMFEDADTRVLDEEIRPWEAARWASRYRGQCDIAVIDVNWPFGVLAARRGDLPLPPWVNMTLKLPSCWDAVRDKFSRHVRTQDLRLVRQLALQPQLSRGEEDFRRFYRDLHAPYIRARFGDAAMIEPEDQVIRRARSKGHLMEIMHDDRVLSAGLLIEVKKSLGCAWLGMPSGLDGKLRGAAMSGLYYFNIRHAFELGLESVRFFGCRPFLNDGALRFKRKWGAELERRWAPDGCIRFRVCSDTQAVRSFLCANPVIRLRRRKLIGQLLLDQGPLSDEQVARLATQHSTAGLAGLKVYSIGGFASPELMAPDGLSLHDLSASTDPLRDYAALR